MVKTDPEILKQQKINDLVGEWLVTNPGTTFRTAYMMIQKDHPELFPEKQNLEVREKNALVQKTVMDAIQELRQQQSHLSFVGAWDKLQRERPELFAFVESD